MTTIKGEGAACAEALAPDSPIYITASLVNGECQA